jgi:hypothetical protein
MVNALRLGAGCLLFASIVIGSISDTPRQNPHLMLGGYHVLAADFHIHSFPLSWGVLSPWDTVLEAQRQGLDAIAMTPHNHTWVAKVGRWFSTMSGGPIVLVGEEIHSIGYHVLAIGVRDSIAWRQSAGNAIDEVHRQNAVAIAAHPIASYSAYDAEALRKLDGAEVVHPLGLRNEMYASQLREFYERVHVAAIGDTDYHLGPLSPYVGEMGLCRTYVFVRERTEQEILDALRKGRTVVYDRQHTNGDPAMIHLAAVDGRLPKLALTGREHHFTTLLSAILGVLGLLGCSFLFGSIHPSANGLRNQAIAGR